MTDQEAIDVLLASQKEMERIHTMEVVNLQNEIIKLKAKLYDLQNDYNELSKEVAKEF